MNPYAPAARMALVLARGLLVALPLAVAVAGCDRTAPDAPAATKKAQAPTNGRDDPDDASRLTLKTPPARLTTERHTGPFAAGDALSMSAQVKPLASGAVKEVRLDTTHKIIEIAPGVMFSAWTFGDQVPGPVVRARVGDRIKFSMTNRSDEPAPGLKVMAPPMMHSMDFHSAMVSPQDKYRSIAPGQTLEFEFVANYPGVYMYHCGTPMVLEHIASGMYGMMIVEPQNGYPTKADREYAIVQSEFYTKPDPTGRKVDGKPLYVLDGARVRTKSPTYTVFNGRYNGFVEKPLEAKPGERVRLFVMNVGPSNTSSFHVVGAIFDRVFLEGNPENPPLRGSQTVLLGSSNSAIVEFIVPEPGSYVMVDHHFANASQGAVGLIAAGQPEGVPPDPEHHNIPATSAPSDPQAVQGKLAFESKCLACHTIAGGDRMGPDLYGVTKRRAEPWLVRWLQDPEGMAKSDPIGREMLAKYKVPMPNQNVSDAEIRQYVAYFKWADANLQPKGEGQPQPADPAMAKPPGKTLSGQGAQERDQQNTGAPRAAPAKK